MIQITHRCFSVLHLVKYIFSKRNVWNNIAGSSNGRIVDSESIHSGSNPGPAANQDYNSKAAIHHFWKLTNLI